MAAQSQLINDILQPFAQTGNNLVELGDETLGTQLSAVQDTGRGFVRDTADLLTLPLRRTLDLLDGFGTRRQAQSKVTVGKKLKVLKAKKIKKKLAIKAKKAKKLAIVAKKIALLKAKKAKKIAVIAAILKAKKAKKLAIVAKKIALVAKLKTKFKKFIAKKKALLKLKLPKLKKLKLLLLPKLLLAAKVASLGVL